MESFPRGPLSTSDDDGVCTGDGNGEGCSVWTGFRTRGGDVRFFRHRSAFRPGRVPPSAFATVYPLSPREPADDVDISKPGGGEGKLFASTGFVLEWPKGSGAVGL